MTNTNFQIHGYTYGKPDVAQSPVSVEDLEQNENQRRIHDG